MLKNCMHEAEISLTIMLKKANVIVSDKNHVLSTFHELLPSAHCNRCLKVKTHTQTSFIPHSISPHDHNRCYLKDYMADSIVCHPLCYRLLLFDAVYILYVVLEHYKVISHES